MLIFFLTQKLALVSCVIKTNKAHIAFLECLMCIQSHLKITVDFVLFSALQEEKVRFGEVKRHAQERGPAISCGGFITLHCPLERLSQLSHYRRSAHIFTVYAPFANMVADFLEGANIPRYYQKNIFWNSAT